MKYTIPAGDCNIATNTTFTFGPVVQNSYRVTAEQMAEVWNRPLDEIRQKLSRLSTNPPEKEILKFDRWLMEAGLTSAVKARFVSNYGDDE